MFCIRQIPFNHDHLDSFSVRQGNYVGKRRMKGSHSGGLTYHETENTT